MSIFTCDRHNDNRFIKPLIKYYAYSIHYFSAESLSSSEASKILACRPGEAEIDEAAALDVELFS